MGLSGVSPVILKYNLSQGFIFSKTYAGNVSAKSYTLDLAASFIYFLLTSNPAWLLKIDATTGVITQTVRTTNMDCSSEFCDMEFSTSGDTLFMAMKDPTTLTAKICSYGLDLAVASNCMVLDNSDPTYSIR